MNRNRFSLVICVLAAVSLAGCKGDRENEHHYENKVFISAKAFTDEVRIKEEDKALAREVTVAVAQPVGYDLDVAFRAAPELIDTYREAYYDPKIDLLPAEHYDLSQALAVIKAGKVTSDPLKLDFVGLDKLDLDKRYVLPVTIASANGIEVLRSARTVYYIFKESSLVNVVADINNNWAWPEWGEFDEVSVLPAFTLETLVFGKSFSNESSVTTIMGIEDVFLVRVGDVTIPKNQLQVAYAVSTDKTTLRGNVTSSGLKLKTGRWYHIAVTFDRGDIKVYLDGVEKASGSSASIGITSVNFKVAHSDESDGKPRCFWIGYSYDDKRFLNGRVSEVRLWNRALRADEIAASGHFYSVDPVPDDILAYWKFDEGAGNIAKDYSKYGNDLSFRNSPQWIPVELPEKVYE